MYGFILVTEKTTLTQKQRERLAIVATTKGNTTNTCSHLIDHHRALYNECKAISECHAKQKQNTLDAFASVAPHKRGPKQIYADVSASKPPQSKSNIMQPAQFTF